jgi:hypothetical protein
LQPTLALHRLITRLPFSKSRPQKGKPKKESSKGLELRLSTTKQIQKTPPISAVQQVTFLNARKEGILISVRKDCVHEIDGKKGWISFVGVRAELQAGESAMRANPR